MIWKVYKYSSPQINIVKDKLGLIRNYVKHWLIWLTCQTCQLLEKSHKSLVELFQQGNMWNYECHSPLGLACPSPY